jgi:hypothetical protein
MRILSSGDADLDDIDSSIPRCRELVAAIADFGALSRLALER